MLFEAHGEQAASRFPIRSNHKRLLSECELQQARFNQAHPHQTAPNLQHQSRRFFFNDQGIERHYRHSTDHVCQSLNGSRAAFPVRPWNATSSVQCPLAKMAVPWGWHSGTQSAITHRNGLRPRLNSHLTLPNNQPRETERLAHRSTE